jgi:putative flippase GtrA
MRSPPQATAGERLRRAWQERAIALKAVSFGLIGVLNTALDLGIFMIAYSVLEVPLVVANVIAWFVAVSFSYVMNSSITFAAESGGKLRWRDYASFVLSGVAGVIANTTALVVASYFVPVLAAKLLAILVSFVVNFSLTHFVVFRPGRERTTPPSPSPGGGGSASIKDASRGGVDDLTNDVSSR